MVCNTQGCEVPSSTSTDEVQVISVTSEDDAQDKSEDCSEGQVEDIVANATDSSAGDLPENIQANQMPTKSTRVKQIPDRGTILTEDWWNGEDLLNAELQEVPEEPKTTQQALNRLEFYRRKIDSLNHGKGNFSTSGTSCDKIHCTKSTDKTHENEEPFVDFGAQNECNTSENEQRKRNDGQKYWYE
eukprot:gene14936-16476_t